MPAPRTPPENNVNRFHDPDYARFAIGFDERDRARLHALIDEVLDSNRWSEAAMTARFEAGVGRSQRRPRGRPLELGRRRAGGAAFRRGRGRDRAVPVEHVHGDAAGGDPLRRRGRVRRLQPRRPVHVVRRLRGEGRAVQADGGVPGPHRRPHRVRDRADRRVLPRTRDLPDRGLRPCPRRQLERRGPAPTAMPASTRCTRPRRSRPARAACSSQRAPR